MPLAEGSSDVRKRYRESRISRHPGRISSTRAQLEQRIEPDGYLSVSGNTQSIWRCFLVANECGIYLQLGRQHSIVWWRNVRRREIGTVC